MNISKTIRSTDSGTSPTRYSNSKGSLGRLPGARDARARQPGPPRETRAPAHSGHIPCIVARPQSAASTLDRNKPINMIITHQISILDGKGQRSEWDQFHGVDALHSKRRPSNPVTAKCTAADEPACFRPASRRRWVRESFDRHIVQQL